jgi:tetratricopeptide (TPR) repeat protein
MAVLALGAFVCVLYVGFDAVYDRLGTLRDLHQAQGGRWQILKDIAVAWTRFPVLGTGLGTHEVVYPMFDRSTVAALASHAENEYAQAAEETGAVGLAALVAFGIVVGSGYVRTLRKPALPVHSAAYGLGFGLIAILVHSFSDFGQHLPANGFLSVVFCALLLRLPRIQGTGATDAGEIVLAGASARRYGIAALVVAAVVWGGAVLDADAARRGEKRWKQALAVETTLLERDWQGSAEEYVELIRHAQAAAAIEPDNNTYRYWLPVYRWRAISRTTDPNTGEVLLPPGWREFVTRIVAELNEARACCPTFGATWSVLGQLERLVLDRDEGESHIQTGYALAPCNPVACLLAGSLDAEAGRLEEAFFKLHRAVKLDQRYFSEVAGLLVEDLQRPDLALQIAGEQPGLAARLARLLDEDTEFAQEVDRKLLDLLDRKCRQDDASAYWHAMLAGVQRRQQNVEKAIECYRKALMLDYGQVGWRLSLAQLLSEQGLIAEAIHEAEICLRLSPGFRAAERLIAGLSIAQTSPTGGR